MSELPGRPNLDQLRRQARELLRAAADGEPSALTRIRAFSARVSLSAAQLALAREHGFASWPALHAEVERRLAELPPAEDSTGRAGNRWSFGGAAPIETPAGTLYPGGLVAGPDHACMDASLMPPSETWPRLIPPPGDASTREAGRNAASRSVIAMAETVADTVVITDDQGTTYALRASGITRDEERGLVLLDLGVDPVPPAECAWLELRVPDGSATRLLPSARPGTRVSRLAPMPVPPAARELSEQALALIDFQLMGAEPDELEQRCSAALARAAELQQSGAPGAAGDLPAQLARLCAWLTGRGPADGLPSAWSGIINTVTSTDGAQLHLDIAAVLPSVDDIVVRVDSLVSEPASWRVYLSAEPSWWIYGAGRQHKWPAMRVHAEDDLGGLYVSRFGGSSGDRDYEELILSFRPRLDPLARSLTLTFRPFRRVAEQVTRTAEQVTVGLRLP